MYENYVAKVAWCENMHVLFSETRSIIKYIVNHLQKNKFCVCMEGHTIMNFTLRSSVSLHTFYGLYLNMQVAFDYNALLYRVNNLRRYSKADVVGLTNKYQVYYAYSLF